MKEEILRLLDFEIGEAEFSVYRGVPSTNEMQTESLLIEFTWDTFSYLKDKRMQDIQITLLNYESDIVYAEDLSDEQVKNILTVAGYEKYFIDMDIE